MKERERETDRQTEEADNRLFEIDADCLRNKQPLRARVTETQCGFIAINFEQQKSRKVFFAFDTAAAAVMYKKCFMTQRF